MPDSNSVPTPPKKPRAPRGIVNKNDVDSLAEVRQVVQAALSSQYNASILDDQITPAFLAALAADEGRASEFLSDAIAGRGTGKSATSAADAQKTALAEAIQGIQSRAYQKFHGLDDARLKNTYYEGTNLYNCSDALLDQIARTYIEKAPLDNLSKVPATRIAALQSLFDAWNAARGVQGIQKGSPITTFEQFKILLTDLEARRRVIQFAADDDFSYRDPLNKVAREAFSIPTNAPFRPS